MQLEKKKTEVTIKKVTVNGIGRAKVFTAPDEEFST